VLAAFLPPGFPFSPFPVITPTSLRSIFSLLASNLAEVILSDQLSDEAPVDRECRRDPRLARYSEFLRLRMRQIELPQRNSRAGSACGAAAPPFFNPPSSSTHHKEGSENHPAARREKGWNNTT